MNDNAFSFDVSEGNFYKNGKSVPNKQSKILFDFQLNFQ
jgi:hypothetical protein